MTAHQYTSQSTSEQIWLNEQAVCSVQQLVETSGLTMEELDDLIAAGVIPPDTEQPQTFPLRTVVTAVTARRLRDDFELDTHGIALAMALLQRIESLEGELSAVRARLSQHLPESGRG